MEERLQKIISRAGITSRRQAEVLIREGRVKVNGLVERELGAKADPDRDEVSVDGKRILVLPEQVYFMLHKPEGFVTTTRDPEGRPTVMHLMKRIKTRIYPVGRLDFATSGLLLLTSDGELTRFLTHPSSRTPKTYQVKVEGRISPTKIEELKRGPEIGGRPLSPSRVSFIRFSRSGRHSWLIMTITEGRTRQIRRMCEAVGHQALKLKRIELGPLNLGDLAPGEYRPLTDREIGALKRLMKPGPQPAPKSKPRRREQARPHSGRERKPGGRR
jgi:23S rRNA pseudouridine2605 synthase